MDQNENNNNEVQSFIYQQIADFEPFITPETLVMVIARDPYQTDEDSASNPCVTNEQSQTHRIAIILKEDDATIEAEACHTDIFEAIKFAKQSLLEKLIKIKEEIEDPKERLQVIEQVRTNGQIH